MTTLKHRPNTALLVVDVQNGVVAGAHERGAVVANISTLVERARQDVTPVIWVQQTDERLAEGSDDWQIVSELTPGESEPVIEKQYADSFEETTLETYVVRAWRGAARRGRSVGPTSGFGPRCTERSSGDTTPPWSATLTRRRKK